MLLPLVDSLRTPLPFNFFYSIHNFKGISGYTFEIYPFSVFSNVLSRAILCMGVLFWWGEWVGFFLRHCNSYFTDDWFVSSCWKKNPKHFAFGTEDSMLHLAKERQENTYLEMLMLLLLQCYFLEEHWGNVGVWMSRSCVDWGLKEGGILLGSGVLWNR